MFLQSWLYLTFYQKGSQSRHAAAPLSVALSPHTREHPVWARRLSSEGLVVASALLVHVAELVGLVAVVAVGDDRVLDALALEVVLLLEALQLAHQLLDEVLRHMPRWLSRE